MPVFEKGLYATGEVNAQEDQYERLRERIDQSPGQHDNDDEVESESQDDDCIRVGNVEHCVEVVQARRPYLNGSLSLLGILLKLLLVIGA